MCMTWHRLGNNCCKDLLKSEREFFCKLDSRGVVSCEVRTQLSGVPAVGLARAPFTVTARLHRAPRVSHQ